jgi:predicted ribosome quality control (RQC) complex YloA/Tae2 family protein
MRAGKGMASKGRSFRSVIIEGFEVLVGKGDAQNDALTFGEAEPHDFWMHVSGPPGSHVVVRNPDRLEELPRPVLEGAAALAAWHSKARGSRGKVEVHVCRVADVSKPRGFEPGQVLLRRWQSVKVYAREPAGNESVE